MQHYTFFNIVSQFLKNFHIKKNNDHPTVTLSKKNLQLSTFIVVSWNFLSHISSLTTKIKNTIKTFTKIQSKEKLLDSIHGYEDCLKQQFSYFTSHKSNLS